MKIKDIIKEEDTKATITNYQPGKSVEVKTADGTQITKDLTKDPSAIGKDEQGNPVVNLSSQGGSPGAAVVPEKPLAAGAQITVNAESLVNMPVLTPETQEEDKEEDDLIQSGKNKDIGGDPTDEFINQVVDRKWERFARGDMRPRGSIDRVVLPESDELYKWLTIAGLK